MNMRFECMFTGGCECVVPVTIWMFGQAIAQDSAMDAKISRGRVGRSSNHLCCWPRRCDVCMFTYVLSSMNDFHKAGVCMCVCL